MAPRTLRDQHIDLVARHPSGTPVRFHSVGGQGDEIHDGVALRADGDDRVVVQAQIYDHGGLSELSIHAARIIPTEHTLKEPPPKPTYGLTLIPNDQIDRRIHVWAEPIGSYVLRTDIERHTNWKWCACLERYITPEARARNRCAKLCG